MTSDFPQRLDLLVLACLATKRRPPSVTRLEKELSPLVDSRLSQRELAASLSSRLEVLRSRGAIDERRAPTDDGLDLLRRALGVRTLPKQWSKVWRALVPALALGLPGDQWSKLASAERIRARVIRQEHELDLPERPTLTQAVDARIWQALGLEEQGPLTLGKLRRAVLEKTLGRSLRHRSVDTERAGQWLATVAAGTTTRDIAPIQRALVSRWLFEPEAAPSEVSPPGPEPAPRKHRETPAPRPAPVEDAEVPERPDLEGWAQQVQALAERTPSGRYGDERVFIASVWHAAETKPRPPSPSLSDFKARLVEANRAGLLRLHRADLVGAMDPQLVSESETHYLNATFHFIEIAP